MDTLGKKLDLLLYTGALLIKCLADSNRVDRNVRRVAVYMGIPKEKFNMHITYTSLIINISDGSHSVTKVQKISHHHANLNVLAEISRLTWKAFQNKSLPLEDYEKEILSIGKLVKVYPAWLTTVAAGISCACFACLFGADFPAMLITAIASAVAFLVRRMLTAKQLNTYMTVAVSAFVAAFIAILAKGLSGTPNHPLMASVLFMIPGLPLINSIDDLMDGFTMTGVTRAATATITIAALSFGIIMAMRLLSFSNFEASPQPHTSILVVLAAAVAAPGFGILFNVPKRALIGCAIGGAIAITIRNVLLLYFGMSLPLASLIGALCVGVITVYGMHLSHVPANVLAVPAVLPMVPGIVMYNAMIGLIHLSTTIDYDQAEVLTLTVQSGVTACLVILGISFGITLPNIFERRYLSRKEKIFRQRV